MIQSRKSAVHRWEGRANRHGEELKQLDLTIKEEGLFCVEWCLVLSVSIIDEGFIVKIILHNNFMVDMKFDMMVIQIQNSLQPL